MPETISSNLNVRGSIGARTPMQLVQDIESKLDELIEVASRGGRTQDPVCPDLRKLYMWNYIMKLANNRTKFAQDVCEEANLTGTITEDSHLEYNEGAGSNTTCNWKGMIEEKPEEEPWVRSFLKQSVYKTRQAVIRGSKTKKKALEKSPAAMLQQVEAALSAHQPSE